MYISNIYAILSKVFRKVYTMIENKFEQLGLSEEVLKAIKDMGFSKPSQIQEKAIPILLTGVDAIGQAQTGTGKTLAFGSVLLSKIKPIDDRFPQAIILSPTRELAMQIHEEMNRIGKYNGSKIVCVFGGSDIEKQIRSIKKGVDIVSNENKYHPIRDYLESLMWDGVPRIENLLPRFLGAEKNSYTTGVMKMHMLAAISRIYEPGIKYDIMLCLVGSQGAGKSTFFKYLAINDDWFSDNLDHLDDENIYRKLQNHWIIEMGEMKATVTAKNIEQIKSFLSRQKETYKVPYEVYPEDRPRQCVFCGTSNDLNFLPLDRTGNRRFAPVMTDITKAKVHILDNEEESRAYIVQAWAEAMVLYQQGNVYLSFTKEIEEEAKKLQKEFMPEDTNAGIIQAFLDDYEDDYVCTKLLFDDALHRTGEMKQWESKEIANIMNNAIEGWKQHGTHRFGKEYGIQRSWKRIEGIEKKDKDGFMEVPEQLEIPFE